MEMVFDKNWFEKWQRPLLWLANTVWGRGVLGIRIKEKITKILPNCITWREEQLYKTEFRLGDVYAENVRSSFKIIWQAFHWWDKQVNRLRIPELNLGFDTLFRMPDTDTFFVGYHTCAGLGGWAELHDTIRSDKSSYQFYMTMSTDPDVDTGIYVAGVWLNSSFLGNGGGILRTGFKFNTSLNDNCRIKDAELSMKNKTFTETGTDIGINIYGFDVINEGLFTIHDFLQGGTTAYSDTIDAMTAGNTYDFKLNATGVAAINKDGNTNLMIREVNYDVADVEPEARLPARSGLAEFDHTYTTFTITYSLPQVQVAL